VSGLSVVTHSTDETRTVGQSVGDLLEPGDVVLLAGELGAGKTQLAKGIAVSLEVEEPVVSPTFTIAREYEGRIPLVHVDVYRLDRAQEVLDLGLDDTGDDAVTVVEWGDVAGAYLPTERLEIRLETVDTDGAMDDDRVITMTPCGPGWRAREAALARALGRSARGSGPRS
jgi:tRNA threonylcarbamoyladenosine biosynthesis protein TsaE